MTQVITLQGKQYDLDSLSTMKGPALVTLHNEVAALVGEKPVNKFADRRKAEARVSTLLLKHKDKDAPVVGFQVPKPNGATAPDAKAARKAARVAANPKPASEKVVKQKADAAEKTSETKVKAPAPAKAKAAPSPNNRARGVNLKPQSRLNACLIGSKQAHFIDMLARKTGATFRELHEAMSSTELFPNLKPSVEATTRSMFGYDTNTVKGYGIRTEFQDTDKLVAAGRTDGKTDLNKDGKTAVYFIVLHEGMTAPLAHVTRKEYRASK